jgi:hypothetical protein
MPSLPPETTEVSEDGIPKGEIGPDDSASNIFCPSKLGHNVPEDCHLLSRIWHLITNSKDRGGLQENPKENRPKAEAILGGLEVAVVGVFFGIGVLGVVALVYYYLKRKGKPKKQQGLGTTDERVKRGLKRLNELDLDMDDEDQAQRLTLLLEFLENYEYE